MEQCKVDVHYIGPGIDNDVAIITFEGDIETLPGNQRGVIEAPPESTIKMHCHDASFVKDRPVVWLSHEGECPHWIEEHHESPYELKLILGKLEEKDVAKFVVNLETEEGPLTSKDPTIVSDPVNMPPSGGR